MRSLFVPLTVIGNPVIEVGLREAGSRTAHFWAYLGDSDHPFEVYDFTVSRELKGPQESLRGYSGFLRADAYGGYD